MSVDCSGSLDPRLENVVGLVWRSVVNFCLVIFLLNSLAQTIENRDKKNFDEMHSSGGGCLPLKNETEDSFHWVCFGYPRLGA
jgi:hypothetical protein